MLNLYGVLLPIFLLYLARTFLDQLVWGLVWKLGRRYNENDVVIIDGEFGRIIRIGLFSVEFYVYEIVDDKIVSGWTLNMANDKLRDLKLKKPLQNHSVPKALKTIHS